MGLRVLVVPFGSEGDVNPLLWMATGLVERGHQVTVLLTPHYGHLAERLGLSWIPFGTEEEFVRFASDPRVWKARVGTELVLRGMVDSIPACVEAFIQIEGPIDLLVTSTLGLAVSCLAESRGIPRITVHMQPTCLRSVTDCPLFLDGAEWLCRSPRWVKAGFFRLVDAFVWEIANKPLNALRRQLGLTPWTNFYHQALHGTEGVAAFFPPWFAQPQLDWPAGIFQTGFPLSQRRDALPEDLQSFLAEGSPPVIWTHGSANFDIEKFQRCALETSRRLSSRCLLVSLAPPALPLPPWAFHCPRVRFEDIFSHCAAVVHHGGIGTTSKAIAAGRPQLVVPRAHDQPDNAYRVEKLGLGKSLPYRRLTPARAAQFLRKLMDSPEVQISCRQAAERMASDHSLPDLCAWAEEIALRGE